MVSLPRRRLPAYSSRSTPATWRRSSRRRRAIGRARPIGTRSWPFSLKEIALRMFSTVFLPIRGREAIFSSGVFLRSSMLVMPSSCHEVLAALGPMPGMRSSSKRVGGTCLSRSWCSCTAAHLDVFGDLLGQALADAFDRLAAA